MTHVNVDCVLDIKASLGESPIWSVKDQILYWVDINNHLICKFDPRKKKNSSINVGDFIGCFALKKNLNIVLALTSGFFELEQKKGKYLFLAILGITIQKIDSMTEQLTLGEDFMQELCP